MKEQDYKNAVLAATHVGERYKVPVCKDKDLSEEVECTLQKYYPHIVLFSGSIAMLSLKYQEVWEAITK